MVVSADEIWDLQLFEKRHLCPSWELKVNQMVGIYNVGWELKDGSKAWVLFSSLSLFFFKFSFSIFWLCQAACIILVFQPGIKPCPPQWKPVSWSLDHQGSPLFSSLLGTLDDLVSEKPKENLTCFLLSFPLLLCSCVLVTQLCLTHYDPIDCSLPVPSVRGILQARLLEWVAISYSRVSSQSRHWTQVSCIAGEFFMV